MLKRIAPIALCAAVVAAATAASFAQSEAPKQTKGIELGGYCPVAYLAMNQAVKGNPQQKAIHNGKTYHLTNVEARKMFEAAPEKYLPAYSGLCATAVAHGMKLEADPKLFTVHDGKAYLFSNAEAKAIFDKDKAGTIAKADKSWATLSKQ
ncbi:MAG: YHS domain-containing (seleno)protein [Vicinamibacterales bacterium]